MDRMRSEATSRRQDRVALSAAFVAVAIASRWRCCARPAARAAHLRRSANRFADWTVKIGSLALQARRKTPPIMKKLERCGST